MEQNVYAIFRGKKQVGHGFLANDFFVTAVHVLRDNDNAFVMIKGEKVEFDKIQPVYVGRGRDNDPNSTDIAFFKFKNVEGGFSVLDYTPQKDDVLESCCLQKKEGNTDNEEYEIDLEPAYALGEVEGNYFHCKCNRHEGSSGSPLIKGNHVIGIMHGGEVVKKLIEQKSLSEEEKQALNLKDDDIICSFLKINAFMSLIEKTKDYILLTKNSKQ